MKEMEYGWSWNNDRHICEQAGLAWEGAHASKIGGVGCGGKGSCKETVLPIKIGQFF